MSPSMARTMSSGTRSPNLCRTKTSHSRAPPSLAKSTHVSFSIESMEALPHATGSQRLPCRGEKCLHLLGEMGGQTHRKSRRLHGSALQMSAREFRRSISGNRDSSWKSMPGRRMATSASPSNAEMIGLCSGKSSNPSRSDGTCVVGRCVAGSTADLICRCCALLV